MKQKTAILTASLLLVTGLAFVTPASAHYEHWTCGGGVSMNGPLYFGIGNCIKCETASEDSPAHYHCSEYDHQKCTGIWTGDPGADGGKRCVIGIL